MGCKEPSYAPSKEFKPDGTPNPNYDPGHVKPAPSPRSILPDIPVVIDPPQMVSPKTEEVEWLGKLTSVSIKPGDVLVVMSPKRLSDKAYERLMASTKERFPDNELLLLEQGATLGIVREETDET